MHRLVPVTAAAPRTAYSVRRFFAGKGVLVTGSTGFLAKAVVEKVLRDLPEVEKIYLLIRPRARANGSLIDPSERLRDEILRNSVFGPLREKYGADFERWITGRIVCVPGDLTHERLGLDEAAFAELASNVRVVINSAATVVFDERLDLALNINTLSPLRLLELAQAANATYIHISTAYVSGMRKGSVPERLLEPLEAIDAQLKPGEPRPKEFDVFHEIERLQEQCETVKADCEVQRLKRNLAPESEEARVMLRRALVSAGMRRARSLGWNDTYTYTKFLGEQLVRARHGKVPTAIVRPSIIESSLREPEPGWLDGLRMADPLIVGFGKGRLADFPAGRNVVLDVIPADLVVNAILAAAADLDEREGDFNLLHVASSSENPLVFENLFQTVRDYFLKHPMLDRAGKPVRVPQWKFPTVEHYKRRLTNTYLRPVKAINALVDGPLPMPGMRKLRTRLRTISNAMEQLLYYVDIYGPYTNLDCRFETSNARKVLERMDESERAAFDFDPRKIRWRHYLQDVHIPGLKRNILRMDQPLRAGAGEGDLLAEEGARSADRISAAIHGVPQTIVELAARSADRFGGSTFLEIQRKEGRRLRLTHAESFALAEQWARKLHAKLGLKLGDRVVLWGENCPEWGVAYLALVRAGATVVPLDRQTPHDEAARLAKFVEAKAAVLTPSVLAEAPDWQGANNGLPARLNLLADLEPFDGSRWPLPDAPENGPAPMAPNPQSLASILFTSGTTVSPKGVMLSHYNFVSDALSVAEVLEPLPNDRFLSVLPLHHAFEFTGGFLTPMFGGSAVHYLEALRAPEVLETMRRVGVTVVLGVPRLYKLFADAIQAKVTEGGAPSKVAMEMMAGMAGAAEMMGSEQARKKIFSKVHEAFGGKLRLFVSGGAALDPNLFLFFQRFGIAIAEGYGLTETAPILTVNPLGAPKPGSVGLPLPGAELRVQHPDSGGVGEVWARGPMVMQGYWRNPEATEWAFEDGWFKTGDLGRQDRDGYLYITGRVKDTIVSSAGKKVFPDELEVKLRGLPRVKEYCVIGLPARGGGEAVALVAVPELDSKPNRKRIREAVEKLNKELPSYQRVARIEFLAEDLPKTSTLKVKRSKVRDRFLASGEGAEELETGAAEAAAPAQIQGRAYREVVEAIAEITGLDPGEIGPERKLELDLGLDSIGRVDLIGKLELRLNVGIPEEAVAKLWTVQDVARVAEESVAKGGAHASGAKRAVTSVGDRVWVKRRGAEGGNGDHLLQPSISKAVVGGALTTTAKVLFNTWLRIDAYGMEHLPLTGAYILASNHSSHLDTAAVREVLGGRAASLHVMGAKDYFFDTRFKSWFFSSAFNVLPFEREESSLDGLALCRRALEDGKPLLIFPEGTRSVTGKLQSFKSGVGLLALELDYPIIPVCLAGTYEALPKGRSVPRPSHVQVRFGPAVDFSRLRARRKAAQEEKDAKAKGGKKEKARSIDLYREAAEQIRQAVARMKPGGA